MCNCKLYHINLFFTAENQLCFECKLRRGTTDPREPVQYEPVTVRGSFRHLNTLSSKSAGISCVHRDPDKSIISSYIDTFYVIYLPNPMFKHLLKWSCRI